MTEENEESGSNVEGNSEDELDKGTKTSVSVEELRSKLDGPDFLEAIRQFFADKSDLSHVVEYVKSGGSVAELVQQLTKLDLKKRTQTIAIFSAIRLVIVKTLIEFPEQKQQLDEECKEFVTEYIADIVVQISSRTPPRHKTICLKLLAALASISDSLALQLLSSISLTKEAVESLAKQTDPFDSDSVRVNFILFLMSFLIDHSAKIIQKLCSNKSWLPSIFPEMKYDLFSTVTMVLTTLETRLLKNPYIPKTQKMFVFNSKSLVHLYNLFNWAPTSFVLDKEVNVKKIKIQATDPNDETEVREMVHGFLLILVSSTKLGVIFADPSYGTSRLAANHTFTYFLQEIGQPWRDPLKVGVLAKLLGCCPDLVRVFCSHLTDSCSHYHLDDWLNVTDLLYQVVQAIEFNPTHFRDVQFAQRVTSRVLFVCTKLLAIASKDGSKPVGTNFRPPMLKVYKCCLKKISSIGDYLAANCCNQGVRNDYLSQITSEIQEVWPGSDLFLVSTVVSFSAKNEEGFNLALDCLFLYANLFPETIDALKYDSNALENVKNMINFFVSAQKKVFTDKQIALIKLIELEILINPQLIKKGGTLERLGELCNIIIFAANEETRRTALSVVRRLLEITNIFTGHATELDLWMHCIGHFLQPRDGMAMAVAVSYAIEKKFEITNVILRCRLDNDELDEVTANLEDFLSMEGERDGDVESSGQMVTHSSLSPLLPAFVRVISSLEDEGKFCADLLSAFVVLSFHDGTPAKLLKEVEANYKGEHLKEAFHYVASLSSTPLTFSPFGGTVFSRLAKSLTDPDFAFEDDVTQVDADLSDKLTSQIITYAVEANHSQTLDVCAKLASLFATKCTAVGLSRCLSRVELIKRFHPILKTSSGRDLSSVVIILASQFSSSSSGRPVVRPYAERFYSELKYALKMKDKVKADLQECLAAFPPFPDDIKNLFSLISTPNFSDSRCLSRRNREVLTTSLFTLGARLKIAFKGSHMARVMDDVRSFTSGGGEDDPMGEDLMTSCAEYLNALTGDDSVDLSGRLLDSSKELLTSLCSADHWYESLAVALASCLARSGQQLNFLPVEFPLNRQVLVMDAAAAGNAKLNGAGECNSPPRAMSVPATTLLAALKTLEPPEWLDKLPRLIDDGRLIENHRLEHLIKKIEKKSDSVVPTKRALDVVKAIYCSCNQEISFARLLHKWLINQISSDTGLSDEICRVYSLIEATNPSDLQWSEDLIKFLVDEALDKKKSFVLMLLNKAVKSSWITFDPSFIFELIASHSQFMSILMTNSCLETKKNMLNILLTLVQKDKSLMKTSQLALFFSAYTATLSACDQMILKLLQEYETSGVNLSSYEPYLWGEAAVEHYSVHRKPAMSKSSPQQTLDILLPNLLLNTIAHFPLNRELTGDCAENDSVYDPSFLIPVICQVARPGNKITTRAIFQSGAVSIVFASLASRCEPIRVAAFSVLSRLQANTRGKDQALWKDIIECIRRGSVDLLEDSASQVPRLSSIASVFLAKASLVLTKPFHPMYEPLHGFFRAKAAVNLKSVPAFLELFHSGHVEHHEVHQQWILEVVKEGLRERSDLIVLLSSMAYKFILDFHSSCLASQRSKALIEEIVKKCLVEVDVDNPLLIREYSLLPWLVLRAPQLSDLVPERLRKPFEPLFSFRPTVAG